MTIKLAGRVAVVTGAGAGLGKAYAEALSRRGAAVVINDIGKVTDGEGAERFSAELVAEQIVAAGGRAVACCNSVGTIAGARSVVEAAVDSFGRIDILINNAGVLISKPFEDYSEEDYDRVISSHQQGSFFAAQAAYRHMIAAGHGRILNTASTVGAFGLESSATYGTAKAGLLGLTRAIAVEGPARGVLCNALLPGAFTAMSPRNAKPAVGQDEIQRAIARVGDRLVPEYVVPLIEYLVSDECQVNGEFFSCRGGHFSRAFMGMGGGWTSAGSSPPTAEDVAQHIDEIRSIDPFFVPRDATEIVHSVADAISRVSEPA